MGKRFLDLDEMLDGGEKIYIRNNSTKAHLFLVVQMKDKGGRNRPLKIPPTTIPINVSAQFSREMIRESSDLRDMITKGNIILLEPALAEKELDSPEAREEMKSLALSVYADTAPVNAVRDNLERLKNTTTPVVDSAEVLKKESLKGNDAQVRVKGLVASLLSKEKSSKDTLAQLKRMKASLTEADLTFIMNECKSEAQIREFAESALAEQNGTPKVSDEE